MKTNWLPKRSIIRYGKGRGMAMSVGEREGDIMQNKALNFVKEKASNVSLVFFKWMQTFFFFFERKGSCGQRLDCLPLSRVLSAVTKTMLCGFVTSVLAIRVCAARPLFYFSLIYIYMHAWLYEYIYIYILHA